MKNRIGIGCLIMASVMVWNGFYGFGTAFTAAACMAFMPTAPPDPVDREAEYQALAARYENFEYMKELRRKK